VLRLPDSCDLHGIVAERSHLPGDKRSNASGKVIAGML
jgi:hypothetical protein